MVKARTVLLGLAGVFITAGVGYAVLTSKPAGGTPGGGAAVGPGQGAFSMKLAAIRGGGASYPTTYRFTAFRDGQPLTHERINVVVYDYSGYGEQKPIDKTEDYSPTVNFEFAMWSTKDFKAYFQRVATGETIEFTSGSNAFRRF